jgi:large subunit ribosomal protein L4
MKATVYNQEGKDTGKTIDLPEEVFGVEPNDHAIYLAVKHFRQNNRQGTHKSKERAEITGSTRKIKRQKGTGTARAGSIKSPLFRGGGRAFGPRPRNYRSKLNKKVKSLARNSALSYKGKDQKISVVSELSFDTPKTKEYLKMLQGMELTGTKTLLVLDTDHTNVEKSARNLKKSKVTTVELLNTYDILNADHLLISEASIEKFTKS